MGLTSEGLFEDQLDHLVMAEDQADPQANTEPHGRVEELLGSHEL